MPASLAPKAEKMSADVETVTPAADDFALATFAPETSNKIPMCGDTDAAPTATHLVVN